MRNDQDRLLDIQEAIQKIEDRITLADKSAFFQNELLQVWAIHHLQIIGEAAAGTSSELRLMHPGIPWANIVAMRNVLVHHYFGIDIQQVWDTIRTDLPQLKTQINLILKSE